MADGVRIQPQPARLRAEGVTPAAGQLFRVRDVSRPLPPPHRLCGTCGVVEDVKTYHLVLDADGTVIVSTTIWQNMQRLYDSGGFEPVNVVAKPPTQGLTLPPARAQIRPARM